MIATILEEGYYRASSNEFARRAEVTWGTIQHQFGSREGLLLAVLTERWETWDASLGLGDIAGDTLEERLERVFDLLQAHYGRRDGLAMLQILLDLSLNPTTSAETREVAARHGRAYLDALAPLLAVALGEYSSEANIRFAMLTMRGVLIGGLVAADVGGGGVDAGLRARVVRAIAHEVRATPRTDAPGTT